MNDLRHKEREGMWFGEVPQTWSVDKMRSVVYERREKHSRKEELMILSLLKDVGVIPYSEKGNIGNKSKDDHTQYKVARTGDLVINSMNVIIGSVGITPYDGYISPAYYSFAPRINTCMSFIGYLCSTRKFQKAARCYAKGIMEIRLRISAYDFLSMPIPLPPLPEQEAIVKYLDAETAKIDKAIEAEEKMVALLQERREIVINEAVGGGEDFNAEAQRRRGWEMRRLKTLTTCNDEVLSEHTPDFVQLEYIEISDVDESRGIFNSTFHVFKDAPSRARRIARKDDVIISTVRTYLKAVATIERDGLVVSTGFAVLRAKSCVLPRYLAYAVKSAIFKDNVVRYSTGTSYPAINASDLMCLSVPLPPFPEQAVIVERLDLETGKIDRAIEVKRRQIALLRERREIIINEVVTGKAKVA